MSLSDEKPVVVTKDQYGKIRYESRGKSIDVTVKGIVYCTPENDGDVKMTTVTPQQLKQSIGEVKQATKSVRNKKDKIKANEDIGGTKQLQIEDEETIETDAKQQANLPSELTKADQILNDLCKKATKVVPPEQVPTFVPKNKKALKEKRSSAGSMIASIVPKADASGVTVTDADFRPDVEARQVELVNYYRRNQGLKDLGRSDCLTKSARAWVKQMVAAGNIYHSQLVPTLEATCGSGWWKKLGENVGFTGKMTSDDMFKAYWNSPLHKQNIVDPKFQRIGVGAAVAYKPNEGISVLWTVQHFAQCDGACKNK